MFEAARAAGISVGAYHTQPDAVLQDAAIPVPLMLQKPQASALPFWNSINFCRCRK